MRQIVSVLALAAVVCGCSGKEEVPAAGSAAPAAPTLADFAGTWNVTTIFAATGDTVHSVLVGSADANGWTTQPTGRPAMKTSVAIVGDSLISSSPEYESVLRKGVTVSTRAALVRCGANICGNTVATYKVGTGTETNAGVLTATKAP